MSEQIGQESIVPEGQGNQEVTQPASTTEQTNVNPAWNDALGVIPSQLHSQVTPHFQKWDKNFQNEIQKVHSQYEPYKPFMDGGYAPEDIQFGLGLIQSLTNNPQEVLSALQEWIKAESDDEQGQNESTPASQEFDITQHPAWQQQDQAVKAMAQILLDQKREEQQSQADEELNTEITSLKEKYKDRGEFDLDFVLGVAMNDPDSNLEKAVEKYYEVQDRLLSQQRKPGPPVLGSGGAIPSGTVDTRKLDDKDRRALVAQMLQQAAQNT